MEKSKKKKNVYYRRFYINVGDIPGPVQWILVVLLVFLSNAFHTQIGGGGKTKHKINNLKSLEKK